MNDNVLVGDDALTEDQAAIDLKAAKNTLRHWRYTGKGPEYFKVGKRVYYSRAKNLDYKRACLVTPGAAA